MRTLVRSPFARFALSAALLASCASSGGGSAEPRAIAVSLVGYGPAPFRLVSESHTAPVDLYSHEASTASTKVLNDEVMVALVLHLDELGFRKYARTGRAPLGAGAGGAAVAKAIEVEDEDGASWWPLSSTASKGELASFQTAMVDFLDLFNIAQSWQSVDNTLGGDYFERKKAGGGR